MATNFYRSLYYRLRSLNVLFYSLCDKDINPLRRNSSRLLKRVVTKFYSCQRTPKNQYLHTLLYINDQIIARLYYYICLIAEQNLLNDCGVAFKTFLK